MNAKVIITFQYLEDRANFSSETKLLNGRYLPLRWLLFYHRAHELHFIAQRCTAVLKVPLRNF